MAQSKAKAAAKRSGVIKRSIIIAGHKTSVSLEDAFWKEFKRIAGEKDVNLGDLAAVIDDNRTGNLSSGIRLFVLDCVKAERPNLARAA